MNQYIIIIFSIFLFSLHASLAKRPEVASYMKGDVKMTNAVLSTLGQAAKGRIQVKYNTHLVYGDGGSCGVEFDLAGDKRLTVFIPYWVARYPKDVRFSVGEKDTGETIWSDTVGENLALSKALAQLISQSRDLGISKETVTHLKWIEAAINSKPNKSISYEAKAEAAADDGYNQFTGQYEPTDPKVIDDPFSDNDK